MLDWSPCTCNLHSAIPATSCTWSPNFMLKCYKPFSRPLYKCHAILAILTTVWYCSTACVHPCMCKNVPRPSAFQRVLDHAFHYICISGYYKKQVSYTPSEPISIYMADSLASRKVHGYSICTEQLPVAGGMHYITWANRFAGSCISGESLTNAGFNDCTKT